MRRNVLVGAAAAVLGLSLLYGGAWLTRRMVVDGDHHGAARKDGVIVLLLVRELALLPVIAAAVGAFVGWNAGRGGWRLSACSRRSCCLTEAGSLTGRRWS